jgi:septal ring factor EnvC (AmiA/AmiB activator)
MSFNLDEWAADIGAAQSGESAIDEMTSEADRVRAHIESKRALMQRQVASDDIKSKLCDKIQGLKKAVPGLAARIYALEDDDPELFKYIRNLEFINQGIWCPRCNIQKNVGGQPELVKQEKPSEEIAHKRLLIEQKKLQAELDNVVKCMSSSQHNFNTSMAKISSSVSDIRTKLNNINKRIASGRIEKNTPAEMPPVHVQSITPPVQSINSTIKKEDLPPRPVFDWDAAVAQKISHMSSDELLG